MSLTPSDLDQFTGTEHWYRHPLNRHITYTDGVKFFADTVGAHWLLDILVTEVAGFLRTQEFIHIKMTVREDGTADITADDGNDSPPFWTRHIDWTDCPVGEWRFYLTNNVILLPSEY